MHILLVILTKHQGTLKRYVDDVEVILNNPEEFNHLHVHYTGGTKVMSVESVASLEYGLPAGINYYSSYLDPRGGAGPTIIDSNGMTYGPSDARDGINVDLKDIAFLNDFELAPFVHEYYDRNARRYVPKNLPAPAILNQNQETEGNTLLGQMAPGIRIGVLPQQILSMPHTLHSSKLWNALKHISQTEITIRSFIVCMSGGLEQANGMQTLNWML